MVGISGLASREAEGFTVCVSFHWQRSVGEVTVSCFAASLSILGVMQLYTHCWVCVCVNIQQSDMKNRHCRSLCLLAAWSAFLHTAIQG